MSFNFVFHTASGSSAQAIVPAGGPVSGATLTVEFSSAGDFTAVVISKTVVADVHGQITIPLTAAEVDQVKDNVFRVKAVKDGQTTYVATGRCSYTPAPPAAVAPLVGDANAALRTFRAATANRQSKGAAIWAVGDSITEGQGVNNATLSWPNLLAQGLRTRYPISWANGGPGFIPPFTTTTSLPSPATLTGSPAQVGYFGPAAHCVVLTGTQTAAYSVYGTSVDVAAAHGSGVLSVSVDGGAAQTFDLTGANEDGHFYRVTFSGRGSHTVTVGTSSGAVYHTGVMVYDQDEAAGFHLFNGGRSGYSSHDWFTALGATTITALARGIQPALVIYSLGANDFLHSEGSASLTTNTGLILDAIRAGCTIPPSILIHVMYPTTFTGTAPEPWDNFAAALRTYAAGHADCAVLDETVRMPAVAGDVLGLYSDLYHPSTAGHQMIADAIAGFVAAH